MVVLKYFSLFSFLFFAINVNAIEHVEFDLNGIKIGDKLTDEFANNYCPKNKRENKELECKRKLVIGGVNVSARYLFYDESLVAVALIYESSAFQDLVKVYSNKFSNSPKRKINDPIILDSGEQYVNRKVSWTTKSGDFTLEKYGNGLTKGYAYLNSVAYKNYTAEKKSIVTENRVLGLFRELFK